MRTQRQNSDGVVSMNAEGKFVVNAAVQDDEPKVITMARAFVLVVNVLTFLGGLALVGIGIYVFIEFNARFSGLLSENAAIGAIVAGIILSLIACVGVFGTVTSSLKFLGAYALVSLAILITILSILGLFVDYITTVSQVAGGLVVFNPRQVDVNDFFASAYVKCCIQNTQFCFSSVPGSEGYCPPVPYCANRNGTEICFAGDYGATPNNPPKLVYQEFCGTLVAFGIAGPAVSSTNACGFPSGAAGFFQAVFAWVGTNVTYPYICIGLLSGIIFFELLATAYLARYIHMVNNGDWAMQSTLNRSARNNKKASSRAESSANHPQSIAMADTFRFQGDDFDASLRQGMSATDGEAKSHKSTKLESGNPIFRNFFARKSAQQDGKVEAHEEEETHENPSV